MENPNLKEIAQRIEKTYIELSIKKPPTYSLKECLAFRTKAKLFDLAKDHGDYVSKYKKKAEMIELVEEILLKNIENDSLNIKNIERKAIAQVIKGDNINKMKIEETTNFKSLGYIYWFYHNKEMQIVCPDEIADIYMKTYEEDYKLQKMEDDILNYTIVLHNIYGVFEIQQLITIWNRYNKKKLDLDLVCELMNRVGNRQDHFWWDYPYVISNYFPNQKNYKEFLKSRVEERYYIPTKQEVEYYMKKDFNRENIYYKKIITDLVKQNSLKEAELYDLMLLIEESCTLNNPFQDIIKRMKSSGFKFKDIKELNKLIITYIHLSNTTRKWYLKGFMPIELSDKKTQDNVIQLKDHKNLKRKKIGRNQICPCGSRKKYKFCCGR